MIELPGSVFQGGSDVARLKVRIVIEYFLPRGAGSKKIENVRNPHTQSAQAGASAAFIGIDRNSMQFTNQ